MRVAIYQTGGLIRRLTAFTLVLWLGGLGCALGCGIKVSAATVNEAQASDKTESCPMKAGHDCCHKAGTDKDATDAPAATLITPSSGQMFCCPLGSQSADPARKVRSLDAPQALMAVALLSTPGVKLYPATFPVQLTVRDRGSTYLRCCVFLI
jgi:hypothetical protein